MRIANRTLVPAVLAAALLCPLAVRQAQAQPANPRPPIAGVQIVVRDLATQQDIGTVEPGGTISVPAGSQVRLIMNAIPTGNRKPLYPNTTFRSKSEWRTANTDLADRMSELISMLKQKKDDIKRERIQQGIEEKFSKLANKELTTQ